MNVQHIKSIILAVLFSLSGCFVTSSHAGFRNQEHVNFFYESGSIFDIKDSIGDDKGPGYYQYPLDKRIRRGTYDLTRFSVYEEGNVYTFVIQLREYVMTEWPDKRGSEDQGFVANVFDIYLDLDARPGSGYNQALPGRDIVFADGKGWDKVILITPLSQPKVYDILRNKTDELSFQNILDDIILPDYVHIQRDRIIVRISKSLLGEIRPETGYQCFVMGFSNVVSPNRLLNKDVRAFPTRDDFGGGWDTHGDPGIMDMIIPEGANQYEILKEYRSEPYRDHIEYAEVPFVYPKPAVQQNKLPTFGTDSAMLRKPPTVIQDKMQARALPAKANKSGTTAIKAENDAFIPLSSIALKNERGFIPISESEKANGSSSGNQSVFIPIRKITSKTDTSKHETMQKNMKTGSIR